jgi:hypothetical protein
MGVVEGGIMLVWCDLVKSRGFQVTPPLVPLMPVFARWRDSYLQSSLLVCLQQFSRLETAVVGSQPARACGQAGVRKRR